MSQLHQNGKFPTERAVLTIAAGKKLYLDMAFNLARSFRLWHRNSNISFCLATDLKENFPPDLQFVKRLQLKSSEIGRGFSSKLNLDKLAPAKKTLFIDADCLVVKNLDPVFEKFKLRKVSVVGTRINKGEWFGDVKKLCKEFNISSIPKFNGGIYYLEKTKTATLIFSKARELERQYDQLGLVRLRGRPNDELLMAISMALYGETEIRDDGSILGDLFSCPELLSFDVFEGKAALRNPPIGSALHRKQYPVVDIKPSIVHFLGDFTNKKKYKEAEKLLQLHLQKAISPGNSKIYVFLTYIIWAQAIEMAKYILRPVFHLFFGFRKVAKSQRI